MLFTEGYNNDIVIHWVGGNGLPFSIKCEPPRKENSRMSFLHDDRLHVYNPETNRLHVLVGMTMYQVTPDGVYVPSRATLLTCANIMRSVDRLTYIAIHRPHHQSHLLYRIVFTDYGGWYAQQTRLRTKCDTLCYLDPYTALDRRFNGGDVIKIAMTNVLTGKLKSESAQPGGGDWILMFDACDGMLLTRRSVRRIGLADGLFLYNLNTGDMLMDMSEHKHGVGIFNARFVGKNIVYIVAQVDSLFIHTMINLIDGSVFTQSSHPAG